MQNIPRAILPNISIPHGAVKNIYFSIFKSFRLCTCGMNSFCRLWTNPPVKVRQLGLSAG